MRQKHQKMKYKAIDNPLFQISLKKDSLNFIEEELCLSYALYVGKLLLLFVVFMMKVYMHIVPIVAAM